jgi:hypothetical protein
MMSLILLKIGNLLLIPHVSFSCVFFPNISFSLSSIFFCIVLMSFELDHLHFTCVCLFNPLSQMFFSKLSSFNSNLFFSFSECTTSSSYIHLAIYKEVPFFYFLFLKPSLIIVNTFIFV